MKIHGKDRHYCLISEVFEIVGLNVRSSWATTESISGKKT